MFRGHRRYCSSLFLSSSAAGAGLTSSAFTDTEPMSWVPQQIPGASVSWYVKTLLDSLSYSLSRSFHHVTKQPMRPLVNRPCSHHAPVDINLLTRFLPSILPGAFYFASQSSLNNINSVFMIHLTPAAFAENPRSGLDVMMLALVMCLLGELLISFDFIQIFCPNCST